MSLLIDHLPLSAVVTFLFTDCLVAYLARELNLQSAICVELLNMDDPSKGPLACETWYFGLHSF